MTPLTGAFTKPVCNEMLTGMLADASGSLRVALILPALCYAVIAGYGFFARRPASD